MLSIGCVIAELFMKKVFLKAAKTEDYLEFLVTMLGMPDDNIRQQIRNKNFLKYMDDKQHKLPRQTWEVLIPGATPDAIDLMKQLFTYDPSKRLNAK